MEEWEDWFRQRSIAEERDRAAREKEINVHALIDELMVEKTPVLDISSAGLAKSVDIINGRLSALRRAIDRIQDELKCRREMSKRFRREMDYQLDADAFSLKNLQGGLGYNKGVDMKRQHLETELTHLRRERRSEALRCWRDLSDLRTELVTALKEYESLLRLSKTIKRRE